LATASFLAIICALATAFDPSPLQDFYVADPTGSDWHLVVHKPYIFIYFVSFPLSYLVGYGLHDFIKRKERNFGVLLI
jgi:hypothetical protein